MQTILADIQKDLVGPRLILGAVTSEVRTWVDALNTYGGEVKDELNRLADPLAGGIKGSLADALRPDVFLSTAPDGLDFPLLTLALVSSLAQKGEALVEAGGVNLVTASPDVEVFNEAFDINGLVTILQQEL